MKLDQFKLLVATSVITDVCIFPSDDNPTSFHLCGYINRIPPHLKMLHQDGFECLSFDFDPQFMTSRGELRTWSSLGRLYEFIRACGWTGDITIVGDTYALSGV